MNDWLHCLTFFPFPFLSRTICSIYKSKLRLLATEFFYWKPMPPHVLSILPPSISMSRPKKWFKMQLKHAAGWNFRQLANLEKLLPTLESLMASSFGFCGFSSNSGFWGPCLGLRLTFTYSYSHFRK